MTPAETSIDGCGPLMQFSARVGRSRACVRVKPNRLEWSLIGKQWMIQMSPMTSITAVTAEVRHSKSSLVVKTAVGTAEFRVEPETAELARTLLVRLVAEADVQTPIPTSLAPVPTRGSDDEELINLKWKFDTVSIDPADLEEEPRRLLGF